MSVRNASSSIYYGNIDTQKWSLVSVNNSDVESPVIISDKLSEEETNKLIAVLEKHQSVLGYALQDLKGINPDLCTH